MKQNREARNKTACVQLFITKEPRIYNGEERMSSVNDVRKTTQPHAN